MPVPQQPQPFNPYMPSKPQPREIPVEEHLVTPHIINTEHQVLPPHKAIPHRAREPRYNKLYGSLMTEGGWRYVVDNYANGTITTIAATQVSKQITLGVNAPDIRVGNWPGAIQMYLCLRSFALSPTTATFATVGTLDCYFQDNGGQLIPLGDFLNNSANNLGLDIVVPTPIQDPGVTNVGNLLVTLNSGATVGTYDFQFGFSYAYLMPETNPYESGQIIEEERYHHGGRAVG